MTPRRGTGVWRRGAVYFRDPGEGSLEGLVAVDGSWVHLQPDVPAAQDLSFPADTIDYIRWMT